MLTSHGCFWIFGTNGEMVLWTERSILPRRLRLDRHLRAGNISCGCASIPGRSAALRSPDATAYQDDRRPPGDRYLWQWDFGGGQRHEKRGIVDENGTFAADIRRMDLP